MHGLSEDWLNESRFEVIARREKETLEGKGKVSEEEEKQRIAVETRKLLF